MSKINTLTLSNFKFFGKEKVINISGNHLLLYGENGSGKSSLFWGVYTLLEASFKRSVETDKYFQPFGINEESLVNIYATKRTCPITNKEHCDSCIKIETDNNAEYVLSLLDSAICGNTDVQESRKATDFINYQSIFKFQDFKNSETPDLYEVFNYSVLPYVTFPSFPIKGKTLTNAGSMWEEYKKGPGTTINHNGDTIQVYKNSPEYSDFLDFEKHFNDQFVKLIDFINSHASDYVKKLGYNIEFELKYTPPTHIKKDKNYEWTSFHIDLAITSYNNQAVQIKKPQSFLNEAKMSAIAVAIRLAIIDQRIGTAVPDALKVLVLDDLMISLDMSNRDKLMDLLLGDFANRYQILFFTHDLNLYNFVDCKIREHKMSSQWLKKEMYVGEDETTKYEFPIIIDGENDSLSKSKKYYAANDYTTCALYIRKALEEIVTEYLPDEYCKNAEGRFVELNVLWKRLLQYTNSIPEDIKKRFSRSRLTILNPSAHYQKLSYPIYKRELYDAIKLIEDLKTISIKVKILLVDKDCHLKFVHPLHNYSFEFKLKQDMIRGKEENPLCIIDTWQYDGIMLYDFINGNHGTLPVVKETRLNKMIENLMNIPNLGITKDMFLQNTKLDKGTLKDALS
ncbi:AAA family ATPase [Parabacteroides distasonis]|uniref:Rad50/SbcC-type AAA domain-containing protein n=1 Tax=Parabacteroides distasonis TaxID=823 RepID=A0A4V3RQ36_PARDI|nr:AAA family ATPase [Parabacteroides distasonis]TGY57890.1 hypothetical protein E5342_09340 [Parabacteroides distasonis]